jgi:predicted PurR-regulated permease PerM
VTFPRGHSVRTISPTRAVKIGAGVIAYLVGLPNPVAWAVLGFLLNFIPYIGALIMDLVLFSVGIVTFVGLVAIHHLFPKPEGALPD